MTITTAPATAAAITNHDEWISFYNAPSNISEFVRTVIGAKDLAEAATGDYCAQAYVAGRVQELMRLESMDDDQLEAELIAARKVDGWNPCEGKFEINEIGHAEYVMHTIYSLRDFRDQKAAEAAWAQAPAEEHLTYNPFAALAVAS